MALASQGTNQVCNRLETVPFAIFDNTPSDLRRNSWINEIGRPDFDG